MTKAIDRFKMLLATAFERICVLEEELEQAQARIMELEQVPAGANGHAEQAKTVRGSKV